MDTPGHTGTPSEQKVLPLQDVVVGGGLRWTLRDNRVVARASLALKN